MKHQKYVRFRRLPLRAFLAAFCMRKFNVKCSFLVLLYDFTVFIVTKWDYFAEKDDKAEPQSNEFIHLQTLQTKS